MNLWEKFSVCYGVVLMLNVVKFRVEWERIIVVGIKDEGGR